MSFNTSSNDRECSFERLSKLGGVFGVSAALTNADRTPLAT